MIINLKKKTTAELIKLDRDNSTPNHLRNRVREELYKRFNGYIFKFSHKLKNCNPTVNFTMLVSAGQLALVEAINTFDEKQGTYFSTWAYNKIKYACYGLMRDKDIPKYYKAIGVNHNEEYDGEGDLFDVPDPKNDTFKLTSEECDRLNEIVEDILQDHLDKYVILVSRFGLDGSKPKSNGECSKMLNITPQQVSGAVSYFKRNALKKYGSELKTMYQIK